MAYRQPFRSGLRELAESLLRRAQTERAYSRVEQQLELQKGEIGANLAQNLTQNVQMGLQGLFQEPEPETYDTGAIRDTITNEIKDLQNAITQMGVRGVTGPQITNAQALLDMKRSLLTLPDSQLPAAYQQTVTTPFASTLPGIPGQSWLPTSPDLAGGDILARAMAGGASAEMATQTDQQIVANLLPKLTFDPDEPASVVQAYMVLDQVDALPLPIRNQLAEQANAVRRAAQSPEAKSLLEAELARRRTDDQIAEGELAQQDIDLQRSKADLAYALRTLNPRVQQTIRALDDEKQDRIAQALSTGVYAGLDEDEQKYLATIVGVEPDGLEQWAVGQVARNERMAALDEQRAELANQQAGLNITIAGLDISEAVAEYPQNLWRMSEERRVAEHQAWLDERERGFAAFQDEKTISEMIGGAIANNDVGLLQHYIFAMENGTALGTQLAAAGNPELLGQLKEAYGIATRRRDLELAEMVDNDRLREVTYQTAKARLVDLQRRSPLELELLGINIDRGRVALDEAEARFTLLPTELEALRLTYANDIAQAERDLRALPLEEAEATLITLGEFARALPPDFWDSPPAYITRSLEAIGMVDANGNADVGAFKSISMFEDWLRNEPLRAEAWEQINLYIQSPPKDEAAAAEMMASVEALGWQLGLDATRRSALMSAVASVWNEEDVGLRLRLMELAGPTLTSMDPVEIKRALDAYSSVSNSLRQQYDSVEPQQIANAGCGTILKFGIEGTLRVQWAPDMNKQANGYGEGVTCNDLRSAYHALGTRIASVNNTQEALANILYPSGSTVAPNNSTGGGAGTGGTDTPNPGGDIDWDSYGVLPPDVAIFNEINSIFDTNREGAQQLMEQLAEIYGEQKVLEILAAMGIQ